jgi:hypothetical protein
MDWPARGIYFFFEDGEERDESGIGLRVVRVGTHALKLGSRTSLWNRLSQHRGTEKIGGGNHRGSIFRLIVGAAVKRRDILVEPGSWGVGSDLSTAARKSGTDRDAIRRAEVELEITVSDHIRAMPFLWLPIDDPAGPDSLRGLIERNSIALLSNSGHDALDPSSEAWLGRHSDRERIRRSGLWNSNHVDEIHDPKFLPQLESLIESLPNRLAI